MHQQVVTETASLNECFNYSTLGFFSGSVENFVKMVTDDEENSFAGGANDDYSQYYDTDVPNGTGFGVIGTFGTFGENSEIDRIRYLWGLSRFWGLTPGGRAAGSTYARDADFGEFL
eukprot:4046958-Pyramimonas_sp.AAC.1